MDYVQQQLKIHLTYISLPPRHGHNLCDGHFAHLKLKLRNNAVKSGVYNMAQIIQASNDIGATADDITCIHYVTFPRKSIKGIKSIFYYEYDGTVNLDGTVNVSMFDEYNSNKKVYALDRSAVDFSSALEKYDHFGF